MPYSVTYNSERGYIYVSVEGKLDLSLFDSMAAEVAVCLKEHDCRLILNDLRHAEAMESVINIYAMPRHAEKVGITRSVRRALVVSGRLAEFRFLETVFLNQGNIVHLFSDIDNARRWLLGEETGS